MPFINQNEAVSPVIGVILLVAVTVILAAVIAAFVFGMAGTVTPNRLVSCTASVGGTGNISITYQGGPDADFVFSLESSLDGANSESTYGYAIVLRDLTTVPIMVGTSWVAGTVKPVKQHLIVTATFMDNTQKVILDTYT